MSVNGEGLFIPTKSHAQKRPATRSTWPPKTDGVPLFVRSNNRLISISHSLYPAVLRFIYRYTATYSSI